jgi:hypothetical protein
MTIQVGISVTIYYLIYSIQSPSVSKVYGLVSRCFGKWDGDFGKCFKNITCPSFIPQFTAHPGNDDY